MPPRELHLYSSKTVIYISNRMLEFFDTNLIHTRCKWFGIKHGSGIAEAEKGIKRGKRDKTQKKG